MKVDICEHGSGMSERKNNFTVSMIVSSVQETATWYREGGSTWYMVLVHIRHTVVLVPQIRSRLLLYWSGV